MDKKAILKGILQEFLNEELPQIFSREMKIPLLPKNVRKALIFIGMRRVGKTYFMFQHIKEALRRGVPKNNILYINFEDDRLSFFSVEDFQLLLDSYFELYPENAKSSDLQFYFDEIQNIEGWDKFIRRLIDKEKMQIFITGSSAKSLSKDLATSLRGRCLVSEVFPLQLSEFLDFYHVNWATAAPKDRAAIKHYTKVYLKRGGFPEPLELSESLHKMTLQTYVDTAVFRDVIDRHQVNNPHIVRVFLIYCLQNISAPLSVTKVHKVLKSRGETIGRNTLYEYLEYFEDAYLLFLVPLFDLSARKRQVNPSKIYCVDPGIIYSYSIKPLCEESSSLENSTYLHLRKFGYENIFYHKTSSGKEIDFIAQMHNGELTLVQVCLSMQDGKTRQREIAALLEGGKELGVKDAWIITLDEEEIIEDQGLCIHVQPFWKWVLDI